MKLIKKINLNINRFRFKWWIWDNHQQILDFIETMTIDSPNKTDAEAM